jgi:hypothetical protein
MVAQPDADLLVLQRAARPARPPDPHFAALHDEARRDDELLRFPTVTTSISLLAPVRRETKAGAITSAGLQILCGG